MKRVKNLMIVVMIISWMLLASCSNNESEKTDIDTVSNGMPIEMPDDFNIVFRYGVEQSSQRDGIDTIKGLIYKDLVMDGEVSGNFSPSKELLEKIYGYLYDVNILKYPRGYSPPYEENMEEGRMVYITPSNVYNLKIYYGEIEHSVYWHNSNGSILEEAMALESAFRKIIVDIANTNEFKELGEVNGGYE